MVKLKDNSLKKKDNSLKKKDNSLKKKDNSLKKKEKINIVKQYNEMIPIRQWFINYYKKTYMTLNTTKPIRDYINDNKNDNNFLYSSTYNRVSAIELLGFQNNVNNVNSVVSIFKLIDNVKKTDIIYAFIYSSPCKNNIKNDWSINFITLGGSFTSKDGEYRKCVIKSRNLNSISTDLELIPLIQDLETYLLKKNIERSYVIYTDYYYKFINSSIKYSVENYSYYFAFKFYVYAWFNFITSVDLNILESNINVNYKNIMSEYIEDDLTFYRHLKEKYGNEVFILLYNTINNIKVSRKSTRINTKLGQKIIPLSLSELQHPFNIRFKPWREYIISINLSDYVINNISPGFSIINSWFYIMNAKKKLFDNDVQYEKMHQSELVSQINSLLNQALIFTYAENKLSRETLKNKNFKKSIKLMLSEKFNNLNKKIQESIDYSTSEIAMSDVALGFISEHVGYTIYDVLILCKKSDTYNMSLGMPFTDMGYKYFAKYLFDICYNLLCINKISGIIHGDLHLNNATIGSSVSENINFVKNASVLYNIGNSEHDQYLFNTVSYNACLIDFSRSIISPEKIQYLKDSSLPKSFINIDNLGDFNNDQVCRLLQLYLKYSKDNIHNKDNLLLIFKTKFNAVFKLLSSIDIYIFTNKLLSALTSKNVNIIIPHKSIITLIESVNNLAYKYITVDMDKLIYTEINENDVNNMEWPMYTIIKKCFNNFNVNNNTDIGNILDVYNINNKLTYSLNNIKKYPITLLNPMRIIDGKEQPLSDKFIKVNLELKNKRILYEKEKLDNITIVNKLARENIMH